MIEIERDYIVRYQLHEGDECKEQSFGNHCNDAYAFYAAIPSNCVFKLIKCNVIQSDTIPILYERNGVNQLK